MPFLILISYGLLLGVLSPIIQNLTQIYNDALKTELISNGKLANQFILDYYETEGRFPDSLQQAIANSELSGSNIDPRVRYYIARDVIDNNWMFDRYLVVVQDVFNTQASSDVLRANACDEGETDNQLQDAKSYCPPASYLYAAFGQSNDDAATKLNSERIKLLNTLRKFTMIHSATGEFPKDSITSGVFRGEKIEPLQDFIGTNDLQEECDGGTNYKNIRLNCSDIFSTEFKATVNYHYISENNIGLFVVTNLKRSDGKNIIVGHELKG